MPCFLEDSIASRIALYAATKSHSIDHLFPFFALDILSDAFVAFMCICTITKVGFFFLDHGVLGYWV